MGIRSWFAKQILATRHGRQRGVSGCMKQPEGTGCCMIL
jgi:hypothetical protein